ncbi:MAG: SNF2 helicase-associated domain-containing protein, partial [Chloroflexota bacterium]
MFIVHGTIHSDSKHLLLWGESDTSSTRKGGRRSKTTAHPFAISADQIEDWLANLVPHAHPELQSFQLWLPTYDTEPQASPELRAMGVFADDDTVPTKLHLWQVAGIALTIPDAVDLLLALTHQMGVGQSLYFWRAAALEALALVMQQQVLPALERDDFHYRAFWQAIPEHPERLIELASQMPPVCRALAETPETAPSPYKLLGIFVDAVADSAIRETAASLKLSSGRGAGAAWLAALTTNDAQLKLPTADSEALFKSWQTWSSQNDAAGNSAFRITFRLDAPDDNGNQKWKLSYLLQATDDPSLIVAASQIWRGQGDTYLMQRFDQPQERLLRGLAFAGRLFTPILDSLRSAAPASTAFDTGLAYTFLQDAAPLLQASGFRVLLPRWWGGKKARLTARAKVSGGKQTSKSRLTLDTLVHYDYQIMLGGEPIEQADFMRLAALKQPLVQLRGQWVLLDTAQIEAGLKFFEHGRGELPLDEVLRLGLDSEGNTDAIPLENMRTDGWLKTLLTALQQPEKIETILPPES